MSSPLTSITNGPAKRTIMGATWAKVGDTWAIHFSNFPLISMSWANRANRALFSFKSKLYIDSGARRCYGQEMRVYSAQSAQFAQLVETKGKSPLKSAHPSAHQAPSWAKKERRQPRNLSLHENGSQLAALSPLGPIVLTQSERNNNA